MGRVLDGGQPYFHYAELSLWTMVREVPCEQRLEDPSLSKTADERLRALLAKTYLRYCSSVYKLSDRCLQASIYFFLPHAS
jgi:hypothetical protein